MEKRLLTFRPTDFELDFLMEHNINWSDSCHQMIKERMGEVKKKSFENVTNRILLIIFGVICYVLAYAVINIYVYIMLNAGAIFLICSGFFLLFKDIKTIYNLRQLRNHRSRKDDT